MATETTTATTDPENSMWPSWAYQVPAVLLILGGLSTLMYLLLYTT